MKVDVKNDDQNDDKNENENEKDNKNNLEQGAVEREQSKFHRNCKIHEEI